MLRLTKKVFQMLMCKINLILSVSVIADKCAISHPLINSTLNEIIKVYIQVFL